MSLPVHLAAATSGAASTLGSGAFTPTAGDLIGVYAISINSTITATITSSNGGDTFSLVDSVLFGAGNIHRAFLFVADQLSTAVSQTLTLNCTGDPFTAAGIAVAEVDGMSLTGLAAIVQSAFDFGISTDTVDPTFGAAAQTLNAIFGGFGQGTNSGISPPTGFTELFDNGGSGRRIETIGRDTGFTGTSVTWASAASAAWGAIVAEFNRSSGGAVTGSGALQAGDADAAGTGTSSAAGAGALQAGDASAIGAGISGSTGSGALQAGDAEIAGSSGLVPVTGTGALQAGDAEIAGSSGLVPVTGTGALQAGDASAAGSGASSSTGAGALAAGDGAAAGAGISGSTGAGALAANDNAIAGVGFSGSFGAGALQAGPAGIAGLEGGASVPGTAEVAANRLARVTLGAAAAGVAYSAERIGKIEVGP